MYYACLHKINSFIFCSCWKRIFPVSHRKAHKVKVPLWSNFLLQKGAGGTGEEAQRDWKF